MARLRPSVPRSVSMWRMTRRTSSADGCDLCEAARITPWFHEDDICWIAECEICAVPMVVWRGHGVEPPADELAHMHDAARRASSPSTSSSSTTSTTTCATSPTTTTRTRRPVGGFFGHGLKRTTTSSDAGRDRARPHDRPRHVGPEGRAVHRSTATFVDGDCRAGRRCSSLPDGGAEQTTRRLVARDRRTRAADGGTRQRVPADVDRRGRGHVAVVGHGPDRRATARRCTTRSSGWTRAARRAIRERVGGRGARAGLRPAQAAPLDPAHRRRAVAVGQGPDRAHPLAAGTRARTSRARRGSTSSRRTG